MEYQQSQNGESITQMEKKIVKNIVCWYCNGEQILKMDNQYSQNGEPILQMENQYSYGTIFIVIMDTESQNGEQILNKESVFWKWRTKSTNEVPRHGSTPINY